MTVLSKSAHCVGLIVGHNGLQGFFFTIALVAGRGDIDRGRTVHQGLINISFVKLAELGTYK